MSVARFSPDFGGALMGTGVIVGSVAAGFFLIFFGLALLWPDGSAWRCPTCYRVFYWGERVGSAGRTWWGWRLVPPRDIAAIATVRHPKAVAYQSDDWGTLLRAEVPGDEPWVAVEVVNSTPEPDGSRQKFWIRIPPTIWTAHEGVAWSFGTDAKNYRPVAQT